MHLVGAVCLFVRPWLGCRLQPSVGRSLLAWAAIRAPSVGLFALAFGRQVAGLSGLIRVPSVGSYAFKTLDG